MSEKKKKKINYITLIWEEMPESISYYIVPRSEIDRPDLLMLKAAHDNFINAGSVNTDRADRDTVDWALCRLNNMIVDPELECWTDDYREEQAEYCKISREEFDELLGSWFKFKQDMHKPKTIPRSRLYRSGFFM